MRAVVQRVSSASVTVDGKTVGDIGRGLCVLLGAGQGDTTADVHYMIDKITNLRIFPDHAGKMNLSVLDIRGAILAISQFTLYGDARKGRRPAFTSALEPAAAQALYDQLIAGLRATGLPIATGIFGAHMDVALTNSGPVTLLLDSSKQF